MSSPIVSLPRKAIRDPDHSLSDDRAELVAPSNLAPSDSRNRPARGAIIGVLLGAALWGVILILAGVIKL